MRVGRRLPLTCGKVCDFAEQKVSIETLPKLLSMLSEYYSKTTLNMGLYPFTIP